MSEQKKYKVAFKGRPKKKESERHSAKVNFKCTPAEKERIKELAKTLSVSEYVRRSALNNRLKIISTIDKNTFAEIRKIGININQMARILNTTQDPLEMRKFKKDLDLMNDSLRAIYFNIKRN